MGSIFKGKKAQMSPSFPFLRHCGMGGSDEHTVRSWPGLEMRPRTLARCTAEGGGRGEGGPE